MALKLKVNNPLVFWVVFIGIILFRLWLIAGVPKMYVYGPHDDLYFAKAAHYIIHGEWLGPYNVMTLIKTPFYAIFLILSFITGLPLILNETIFYVVACIILYIAFAPLITNRWLRLLLFFVLLFCPVSLVTMWTLRIYREFVYYSLTLFVVAFSMGLFLRLDRKISTLLWWVLGLSAAMGAFMITREEGVWIYPVLFWLLAVSIFLVWKKDYDRKWIRTGLILLPIILWNIPTIAVSAINYSYYGFWGTSEQLDSDFNRVLITLDRIKTDDDSWHPAIQIPQEARVKAYEVSTIFSSIKEDIEYAVVGWNISDDISLAMKPDWYLQEYGDGGSEIGSHFLWLFRDVIFNNGYYEAGKFPKDFYRKLADQLEDACEDGKLDCSPSQGLPYVGAIDRRHVPIIMRMFYDNLTHLLNQDYVGLVSMNITQWTKWPENNNNYMYFDEFSYNSIPYLGFQTDGDESYIVNGSLDIRMRILPYKESLLMEITNFYKGPTRLTFITGFIAWIYLTVAMVVNKQRDNQLSYLIITIFALGLLIIRLTTLAIVDATTSVPGIIYGDSNYIFIYIFSFASLFWLFTQLKSNIRKQT